MLGEPGKFCRRGDINQVLEVWMNISKLNEWKGTFEIEEPMEAKF